MALTFREAEVSGRIRWGPEGPPEEAYSRVTDAGRFAPLHDAATEMFDRLEAEYEVERVEGSGLDDELEERLTTMVDSVTTGGFREAVRCPALPFVGDGWLKSEFGAPAWQRSRQSILDRSRASRMAGGRRRLELDWKQWPRRRAAIDP
jgi:hypothetical protein